MLYVHYMHTLVCRVFKWNYEQHLYCHTLISTDIKFARTNVPLSKGAKRTKIDHITVIMQYFWDKTIARRGGMYKDDLGILSLVIKCFGISNTSVQNFAIRISSVKTVPKCLWKLKVFFFYKFNINVSYLLMSPLRAIVICQKYFGNHEISSEIHLFAHLPNMRRCTLCIYRPDINVKGSD